MNRNLLIGGIIAVLLIVGFGAFLVLGKKTTIPPPAEVVKVEQKNETNQPVVANSQKSLRDLITSGQSQKCTFSVEGTSGTVSIANSKMRGDFNSTVNGKVTVTHIIIDGTTMNMWMDGQTTGYKMSFDPKEQQDAVDKAKQNFDPDKKVDYKCESWTVDNSLFTVPTNIKFTDFGTVTIPSGVPIPTQGSGSAAQDTKTQQCAACNSLTGDTKAQCLAMLKCN